MTNIYITFFYVFNSGAEVVVVAVMVVPAKAATAAGDDTEETEKEDTGELVVQWDTTSNTKIIVSCRAKLDVWKVKTDA